MPRCPGDEFLILGTDGVWDVLTNQVCWCILVFRPPFYCMQGGGARAGRGEFSSFLFSTTVNGKRYTYVQRVPQEGVQPPPPVLPRLGRLASRSRGWRQWGRRQKQQWEGGGTSRLSILHSRGKLCYYCATLLEPFSLLAAPTKPAIIPCS